MAIRVEVPYEGNYLSARPLEEAFRYFSDVQRSVPPNFPGVETFEETAPQTYRWVFEKVGYSGYELQIRLITKVEAIAPNRIQVTPIPEPGACSFEGGWTLSSEGTGTRVGFKVHFVVDLPIPGFLKAMAVPLAQKELSKLFDRYLRRVEKNFG